MAESIPHEQVLREKYIHQRKLKKILDDKYGPDNYSVRSQRTRFILSLPWPIEEDELRRIEKQIKFHYKGTDGRG